MQQYSNTCSQVELRLVLCDFLNDLLSVYLLNVVVPNALERVEILEPCLKRCPSAPMWLEPKLGPRAIIE